ncbi:MAG TPA: hypothetical protein VM299_04925 [Solirubrobacteraceae bacterium]|jgi:hypothetical protein|nr:hypothetical protein [Solirubrobacteraceae bacterium]
MITYELSEASAAGLRERLELLERERASATLTGLAHNGVYLADLSNEIAAVRSAYVGAAVTEIASLRAALGCPLVG